MSLAGLNKLFKKKKGPKELATAAKDCLLLIEKNKKDSTGSKSDKAIEELAAHLAEMKLMLYGEQDSEPNPDHVTALANEVYKLNLLTLLVEHLEDLEFESRKSASQIFNNLLKRQASGRFPTVEYICRNTQILDLLIDGYEKAEIALIVGSILREFTRHEILVREILSSPKFFHFFKYVDLNNFEVASDAFATFKEILSHHKVLSADWLDKSFDVFFQNYTTLLESQNYVTRRQSLKILGELLLDRSNFNIMTRYISMPENLKLMMNLLRDKSKLIQFEAFHVFKVFVANPNKVQPIKDILIHNREKLIDYLNNFHTDRDDPQFNEEKQLLIKEIKAL